MVYSFLVCSISTNFWPTIVCSNLQPTIEVEEPRATVKTNFFGAGEEPRVVVRQAIIFYRKRELLLGLGASFLPFRARAWGYIVVVDELVGHVKA